MKLSQKYIHKWHRKTFPNANRQAILNKLKEEAYELIEAISNGDDRKIAEECVDVFIVTIAFFARVIKRPFELALYHKMGVNENRQWGTEDENGDRPRNK